MTTALAHHIPPAFAPVDQAADEGVDALILGEMGIGDAASAALLMLRLAPAPRDEGSGGVLVAPMLRADARPITETASVDDVLAGKL